MKSITDCDTASSAASRYFCCGRFIDPLLLRRFGFYSDNMNAPIAGFISGLSLAIDSSNRRQLVTILTMSRAIESSIRIGEDYGAIPKLRHRDLLLWLVSNCFLQTCMGFRQSILNNGLRKFFQTWS